MSTLSSFVTPGVVITTTYGATNEDKASITANLDFSVNASLFCPVMISWLELFVDVYYSDVIISAMVSEITGVSNYSTVCWGVDQRKHQDSASLTFVRGIHRWPVNSPHKGPATRKNFPFADVIMHYCVVAVAVFFIVLGCCWGSSLARAAHTPNRLEAPCSVNVTNNLNISDNVSTEEYLRMLYDNLLTDVEQAVDIVTQLKTDYVSI